MSLPGNFDYGENIDLFTNQYVEMVDGIIRLKTVRARTGMKNEVSFLCTILPSIIFPSSINYTIHFASIKLSYVIVCNDEKVLDEKLTEQTSSNDHRSSSDFGLSSSVCTQKS